MCIARRVIALRLAREPLPEDERAVRVLTVDTPLSGNDLLVAVTEAMVSLHERYYHRTPVSAKTQMLGDDLLACVLGGVYTDVEQTLLDGGRGDAVIKQRMEFQEVMRERFAAVIEDATGRRVIGFMSGNQQHPDLMCEVFILAPTDLIDAHELPAHGISPGP